MAQKRKASNTLSTQTIPIKAPYQQLPSASVPHLLRTRPWLTRLQSISSQDFFVLHSRDNLVPGASVPKDWDIVAAEFNEAFKNELKKPLAWNTLRKRCGVVRKVFLKENAEYAAVLRYPVPHSGEREEEGDGGEEMTDGEEVKEDVDGHTHGLMNGQGMMDPENTLPS